MPAQQRLFDPGPQQRPERNYDPNEWVKSPDVSWHASFESTPPKPTPRSKNGSTYFDFQSPEHYAAGAFHTGTLASAMERTSTGGMANSSKDRPYLHPYALSGQFALPRSNFQRDPQGKAWNDDVANYDVEAADLMSSGQNIAYRNRSEDAGSFSFATARSENLSTWSESTLADPNAPRHLKHLAEHYELVGKRSEAYKTPRAYPQALPGMDQRVQQTQMGWDRPHPQGTIGLTEDPAAETIAKPVVHTMKRKY